MLSQQRLLIESGSTHQHAPCCSPGYKRSASQDSSYDWTQHTSMRPVASPGCNGSACQDPACACRGETQFSSCSMQKLLYANAHPCSCRARHRHYALQEQQPAQPDLVSLHVDTWQPGGRVRNCGRSSIVQLGCQKSCPLGHLQQHYLRSLLFSDTIEQLSVAHSSSWGIDATADAPVSHSCTGNFATSEPDRTCMLHRARLHVIS